MMLTCGSSSNVLLRIMRPDRTRVATRPASIPFKAFGITTSEIVGRPLFCCHSRTTRAGGCAQFAFATRRTADLFRPRIGRREFRLCEELHSAIGKKTVQV